MGLHIRVMASPQNVVDRLHRELAYRGSDKDRVEKDIAHVVRMVESALVDQDDIISVSVGCYSNLPDLRRAYAKHRGMKVDADHYPVFEGEAVMTHLINHSDCSGYYVPCRFGLPVLTNDLSVGSSLALLEELRYLEGVDGALDEGKKPDLRHPWDCLYIAALASTLCREVIYFE